MSISGNGEKKTNSTDTAVTAVEITKTTAVTAVARERYQKKTGRSFRVLANKEIDLLINDYADLTKTGKDMKGYYAQVIRIIGEQRFRELASTARADGRPNTKPGYFSWLLKREAGPIHA